MTRAGRECPWCDGTGRVALGPAYERTHELLKAQREPISGADLARLAGCLTSAMCNRLVHLERLGLARGERSGRKRLWVAT